MKAFFRELRRRGVLGALAAYAVAAAGFLQLADIVAHNLDFPAWTVRALIWLSAAGFVATFAVSWFYDLTRRGFVRTQAPAGPPSPRDPTPALQPPPVPRELAAGAVLAGRYQLEREIGKGGMGRVLAARDARLGRRVAIKLVTAAHDPSRVRRFELEARTAGSLEHPNVLAVYDLGEHDGVPFLVTELLEGHTLRTVADGPRLPPAQVHGLAVQLARGLAAAHARGIVHRDLKPENVFLTDDGRLKILDFGLARLAADDENAQALTVTGAIFGSPGYLSPEQARGEKATPASDVFSAGAIVYEMLARRRAFPGASLIESGHAILHAEPPPLPPDVPKVLASIVARCLAKAPGQRFHSGGELARSLEAFDPGVPVSLPPRPRSWRKSTSVRVAVAALAIGAALASAVRVSRSVRDSVRDSAREEKTRRAASPRIPAIPEPPIPPSPPSGGHPDVPGVDAKQLARDLRRQLGATLPRAGTIGLIAGARALERNNQPRRAEEMLARSRDPIARLELFLLQRKSGRTADAQKVLAAFAATVEDEDWPAPLLRAYLGELKDGAVIAAATDSDERCEAEYYLGRLREADDAEAARRHLEAAASEHCDHAEVAAEELKSLQRR